MRLFQAYYNDFGPDALRIIEVMVDELGGLRLRVPKPATARKIIGREWLLQSPLIERNRQILVQLYGRMRATFGEASGKAIMRKFLLELSGCRISFPSVRDLRRQERNRNIRNRYNGENAKELAILFGISAVHVRRIL